MVNKMKRERRIREEMEGSKLEGKVAQAVNGGVARMMNRSDNSEDWKPRSAVSNLTGTS